MWSLLDLFNNGAVSLQIDIRNSEQKNTPEVIETLHTVEPQLSEQRGRYTKSTNNPGVWINEGSFAKPINFHGFLESWGETDKFG